MNIQHKLIQFHSKKPTLPVSHTFVSHYDAPFNGQPLQIFAAPNQDGILRVIDVGVVLEHQTVNGGVRFSTKDGSFMLQRIEKDIE